jgi:hypothetical protein
MSAISLSLFPFPRKIKIVLCFSSETTITRKALALNSRVSGIIVLLAVAGVYTGSELQREKDKIAT